MYGSKAKTRTNIITNSNTLGTNTNQVYHSTYYHTSWAFCQMNVYVSEP